MRKMTGLLCAHAVRVSLKSVAGVDSVEVSLEKGLAVVKMKTGNTVTLKQLNQAITKNGFTMKDSSATVAGKVIVTNGKIALQVSGSTEVLDLIPDAGSSSVTSMAGKSVSMSGTIPEAAKGKAPDSIRYRSVEEEQSK
jgi:copper chaperone CopZ